MSSMSIKPNLFLVGAMKAGSTALADMLATSYDIWMCPVKEPNHFCTDLYVGPKFVRLHETYPYKKKFWISDRQDYLTLFPQRTEKYVGEVSPTYLNSRKAAAEIFKFNSDAKILVILRDPIERAYSEYQMNCTIGIAETSFSAAIRHDIERYEANIQDPFERYVTASCYYLQVKRYLDIFPVGQVLVQVMDRPNGGFDTVANDVEKFLGVMVDAAPTLTKKGANVGVSPRLPRLNQLLYRSGLKGVISQSVPTSMREKMKQLYYGAKNEDGIGEADRALLRSVFRPDVEMLSGLIQQDLSHWLKPKGKG